MQGVAELVEQGGRLVEAEKRRLAGGGLREVADVVDDRSDVPAALLPLLPEIVHPGSPVLAGAGEVVDVEESEVGPVGIQHLVGPYVRVVDGGVGAHLEGDAEERVRDVEGGLLDAFQLEVGLDGLLVEVEPGAPQLLRVEPPVPSGQLEVAAVPLHHGLEIGALRLGFGEGGGPEPVEELVDPIGPLGHVLLQNEVGMCLVAQKRRAFGPQCRDARCQWPVVVCVVVAAQMGVGLIQRLAQIPPLRELQQGRPAGALQRKPPLPFMAPTRRRLGSGVADGPG